MAHIKLKYTLPFCTEYYPNIRLRHNEYWFCDESGCCPDGRTYKRPEMPEKGNTIIVNPICAHCESKSGEFEKTVKRYEYFDGVLKVAADTFEEHEIDYLEIDGRVLVDRRKVRNKK